MKKFLSKFRFLFKDSDKENIKNVIEDLIDENKNGSEKIDDGTKNIFKNVINLSDKCLEDVMVPRADVDAVSANIQVDDLVSFINKTKHSRIPVFEDNLDKIIGMIHIRDLFEKVDNKSKKKLSSLSKKIMRKMLFSSPSMKILDLLLKMRSEQIHMSIVVDEFGGTYGLVTIEDLVEEIVGEIKDEHDFEEGEEVIRVKKNVFNVSARVSVEDFEKKIGVFFSAYEKEDVDTVGGLVFNLLGKIPNRGEVINHKKSGLEFTILDADTRKIKNIQVNVK
tara:strand:+ start:150 stop:986 length:837 start_codon:yes stop_codon:yes gene_type:complete